MSKRMSRILRLSPWTWMAVLGAVLCLSSVGFAALCAAIYACRYHDIRPVYSAKDGPAAYLLAREGIDVLTRGSVNAAVAYAVIVVAVGALLLLLAAFRPGDSGGETLEKSLDR